MLGIIVSLGVVAAQENCPACNDTPPELQAYLDAMEELIALLPVEENTDARVASGAKNALADIKQGANLTQVTIQQILAPQTDYDLYTDIQMTMRDASLQRDWNKLLNIQIKLINRTLAMVNAKQHIVYISPEVAEQMNTILETQLKYVRLVKDGDGYWLATKKKDATYQLLAQILWHMHMLYQDLHEENWYERQLYPVGQGYQRTKEQDIEHAKKQQENNILSTFVDDVLKKKQSFLTFKKNDQTSVDVLQYLDFINDDIDFLAHVWQIGDEYGCTVGIARNECLTEWQATRNNISYTFKERLTSDTKRAINTFKSSWGRLKGAFGRGSPGDKDAAKQREESLLNSYWGEENMNKSAWRDVTNVSSRIDPHPVRVDSLWKMIARGLKKESNSIEGKKLLADDIAPVSTMDSLAQDPTQFIQDAYIHIDQKKSVLAPVADHIQQLQQEPVRYIGSQNQENILERKVTSMQYTFENILRMQGKMKTQSVFTDVNRTTKRFPLLSAAVYENIQLLGKKNPVNETEGGRYTAMGQVCELQCQNIDGKTCYHFGN